MFLLGKTDSVSEQLTPDKIRRILVFAPNWIGDAVMCTPALQSIRLAFSSAEIFLLARPSIANLLNTHSCVDRIIEYEHQGEHSGLVGKWRLGRTLQSLGCDSAVLFPNSFNAALVAFLARIPRRFGYATDGRSLLLTDVIALPPQARQMHQVKYYEEFIRSICQTYSSTQPVLSVATDDVAGANKLLARHAVPEDSVLFGLNPGAMYGSAKQWLPERFAEAADHIVQNMATHGVHAGYVQCVIVGAPGEETLGQHIAGLMRTNPVVLSGKTSLGVLKAVIKRCRLFLTNDTGPMHIANALGTPVVAVFGPTNHVTTSPYGEGYILVRTPVDCSPCMLRECPIDHRCMTGVTVEQVVRAAEQVLAGKGLSPLEKIWVNP